MNKLALKLINWYQGKISPGQIKRCRYTPTCSQYAKECYETFNFFKASFLSFKRILKCNPLFKMKHDPIPEKKPKKKKGSE